MEPLPLRPYQIQDLAQYMKQLEVYEPLSEPATGKNSKRLRAIVSVVLGVWGEVDLDHARLSHVQE